MTHKNGNNLTNKELLQIILDNVEQLNTKLSDLNEKKVSKARTLFNIGIALTTVSFLVLTVVM